DPVRYRKRIRPPPTPPREPVPETVSAPAPVMDTRPSVAAPHWDIAGLLSGYRPRLEPGWRGGDMLAGGLIPKAMLPPRYPYRALLKGIEGEVVVGFEVGEQGEVVRVWVVSASPDNDIFVDATLNAVSKWRFRPPRDAQGHPISVQGQQTIGFVLRDALPTAEPVAGTP
ncbi:MAG: energy transducer TonB, partial [Xanthomonadales bacterium]|nr:energy transducer TonB [Xanthomonadales bacterium]